MKKIININLSGRVIPIEDAAYESLQRYIESLRRYFANEDGRDEIINDIESRIAELMNDRIRRGATAVTEADIEEIISSMGRVEDFAEAEAAEGTSMGSEQQSYAHAQTATAGSKRFKGRLYRDRTDKILGGVCSGIANYINVDPAIVRLLFAIITFGGFGFGIFLYLLAWIILPARDLDGYVGKRLFRNPDDRIIGGVAGGLAAYFNKETWVIRLIFVAPLLLNILFSTLNGLFNMWGHYPGMPNVFFGSFTGTFILAYIILWIVLPEARSPFEKMEMRGEKVDVNRIRQNVQEGMSDFRNRAQAWGEEVKTSAQQFGQRANEFANTRGRAFASEVAETARPVASGLGHAIGVLFKAFFLFIAGTIAFALFVMLLVFTLGGVARPFNNFLLDGFWQNASLWGIMIFFLAVPLIAIITWIVRRAMRVRSQNRYLGWTFSSLWLLGWICLMIFVSTMVRDFRYSNRVTQEVPVSRPDMNKMTVRIDEPEIRYSGNFAWMDDDGDRGGWDLTDDTLYMSNVKVRVAKSEDSFYHVTMMKYSHGRNRNQAARRAQSLHYTASSMDSALVLGSGFGIGKNQKFRNQRVIVEIKVPAGKQIRFDESVADKLHFTNIRIAERRSWRNGRWDVDWDEDSYYDWEPNIDYTMTSTGELVRSSSTTTTTGSGVYEYRRDSANRGSDLDSQIEQQRRRLEEESRRLRELEQNRRDQRTTKAKPRKSKKEQPGFATQLPTPVFSLLI